MASLPRSELRVPAAWALRSVLASKASPYYRGGTLPRESLSEDAIYVLEACEALRMAYDQDGIPIDDAILLATAKTLVETVSVITLRKLSHIAWHFDASLYDDASQYPPSWALDRFLEQPIDDALWRTLHARYDNYTPRGSLKNFKASHDFLLNPILGSLSSDA